LESADESFSLSSRLSSVQAELEAMEEDRNKYREESRQLRVLVEPFRVTFFENLF